MKFLNKWICKVRKHKGEITSYLPWVVVGDNHPNWVGTAGHCTRCGYEWDDTQDENLIVIGNNKEQLNEQVKKTSTPSQVTSYSLLSKSTFSAEEVMERFNLSQSNIDEILNGENLELEDCDLFSNDYFDDCELTIEELRNKRKIDAQDFDAKGIIEKIAKEHTITPQRKKDLIKWLERL